MRLVANPTRDEGMAIGFPNSAVRHAVEAMSSNEDGPPPTDRLDGLCAGFEDFLEQAGARPQLTLGGALIIATWVAPLSIGCRRPLSRLLIAAIRATVRARRRDHRATGRPRFNTVRYGCAFALAAKWRALMVPPPSPPVEDESTTEQDVAPQAEVPPQPDKPSTPRSGWRLLAELLRRCFQLDVDQCSAWGGPMRLRVRIT